MSLSLADRAFPSPSPKEWVYVSRWILFFFSSNAFSPTNKTPHVVTVSCVRVEPFLCPGDFCFIYLCFLFFVCFFLLFPYIKKREHGYYSKLSLPREKNSYPVWCLGWKKPVKKLTLHSSESATVASVRVCVSQCPVEGRTVNDNECVVGGEEGRKKQQPAAVENCLPLIIVRSLLEITNTQAHRFGLLLFFRFQKYSQNIFITLCVCLCVFFHQLGINCTKWRMNSLYFSHWHLQGFPRLNVYFNY